MDQPMVFCLSTLRLTCSKEQGTKNKEQEKPGNKAQETKNVILIKTLAAIVSYLDVVGPLVALFFAVIRNKKSLGGHILIVLFLFAQLILNSVAKYMMFFRIPNGMVYQVNCWVSLIILSFYFALIFLRTFRQSLIRIILLVVLILTNVLLPVLIMNEDNSLFNSHSFSFTAFIISAYTILFYYIKLANPVIERITATRSFWFISGLFIYYSGSFFIFSTYMLFTRLGKHNLPILWSIHNVILLLMCIFISKGFRCRPYQKISL